MEKNGFFCFSNPFSPRRSVNRRFCSVHAMFAGGGWIVGIKLAEEILRAFLAARFSSDEDFRRRVKKLEELESFRP
jgi:hypothetical protein